METWTALARTLPPSLRPYMPDFEWEHERLWALELPVVELAAEATLIDRASVEARVLPRSAFLLIARPPAARAAGPSLLEQTGDRSQPHAYDSARMRPEGGECGAGAISLPAPVRR